MLDVVVVGPLVDRGAVPHGVGAEGEGLAGLDAANGPAVPQGVQVEVLEAGQQPLELSGALAVAPGVDEATGFQGVVLGGPGPTPKHVVG